MTIAKPVPYSDDDLQRAREIQPEIKAWLAKFPMHTGIETTLQMALWHVQQQTNRLPHAYMRE